jgi:hypothetical protein
MIKSRNKGLAVFVARLGHEMSIGRDIVQRSLLFQQLRSAARMNHENYLLLWEMTKPKSFHELR